MRVAGRAVSGRRFRLAGWLGRRVRRVATGTGMLALAVPLAWPSGAGGQHLNVPTASSVRSGVVRLADWVAGDAAPPPTVPVQQSGTAAGKPSLVPASATRGLTHVTGHAPGQGKGQLPQWAAHGPGGSAAGTFTAGSPARGFDPATSTLVAAGMSADSDLYLNADGSHTRKVWSLPVNYQTASGTWAPIDATLVPGSGSRWQEKANSLAVSFAAAGSDTSLASLGTASGSQQVAFSLAGAANVAAAASGSSLTYAGILPGTDVTETATPDGISESLTLSSPAAGTSWTFPLTLQGLTATLNGDSVDLTDSAGHLVAVIPPAVARSGPVNLADPDSQASSQLTYQLVTQNGVTALEMSLDPAWLNAPGRVFPVIVDPTVNMDTQGSDYAQSNNGTAQTANNSGSVFLPSGTTTASGTTYQDIDFLNYPNVGSAYANDHLTSASLNLFDAYAAQCTTADTVTAYQVTGSWSPSSPLTYPGPAYTTQDAQWTGTAPTPACSNTSGLAGQGGWVSLPMNSSGLGLLNQWTANSGTNSGFAVLTSLTNSQQYMQFDSYNDGSVSTSQGGNCTGDCRPYLSLTYTTTASDIAPQVNSQYPPNNYNVPTLTPDLIASGSDADNWPFTSLQYKFALFNAAGTQIDGTPSPVSSDDWTVPAGDLAWGQTYHWTVQAYDGDLYSPSPQQYYFTTAVPQPLVTSQLSQNPSGPGFNAQTGNWTTSATDAQVSTVGPALEITRDYNSSDPRISGAFGAGWSSALDMKVSAGENGGTGATATQVVTYPDGEEVGFGLNPDGQTYSPPSGRYATLAPVTAGGFTLTDKNDTVYTFTQALSTGVWGITSITDALQRTETFTDNGSGQVTGVTSASGRSLTVNWTTPSGAAYPHVASVVTPDATAGNASTAQTWTYQYAADKLSAACPPASATACTAYTYTAGSDYPVAVRDSGPQSYWRLDETSGSTAASSVLANEGLDNATYSGTTLGQDTGPLAGSAAKAATFTGSSYVTLPANLVSAASYQTISLWFKTSAAGGVLWSSSAAAPAGTTTGSFSPELYVGSDGKLVGAFWDGNASDVMTSPSAVNNGQWHNAVLAGTNSGEWLYLDGVQVGTLSKGFVSQAQTNSFVGSGYLGGAWPDEPHYNPGSSTGYASGFVGDISDAAIWTRQVTPAEVQAMYTAGTRQPALLSKLTRPSGSVYAQVSYDPLTSRVTTDTDSNGGTWQVSPPTAKGSSQGWEASVLAAKPNDYYRLNDTGASDAYDTVYGSYYCWPCNTATYYGVTEGVSGGPFTDQPVAGFDGHDDYLGTPSDDTASGGPGTVGLWFKTTGTSEVLFSEETGPVTGSAPSQYDPVLYIGKDGKLNGELYDGNYTTAVSTAAVNDGNWHYAVLAAGSSTQALYVDGALQATISGSVATEPWTYAAAGAGFAGGFWPDLASSTVANRWFSGDLAELAWYPYQLSAAQVSGQWKTVPYAAGLLPDQVDNVTDPGGNTLNWIYDLVNGGRELSSVNAEGGITGYAYDTAGFQASVSDPDGNITQTGRDPRGNMVSQTTCQDMTTGQCSTSYWTYYPDDTSTQLTPDPRNDMVLTYADGRSASSTDTTYQTRNTYDSLGDLTAVTSPPVAGYPSGRTTSNAYTSGTSAGGYQGAVPPKGLPYQVTTPGGAVTTTLYYADGDVAQVTTPDGQRTVYSYDGLGRKASQVVYSDTYPGGLTTTYAYDVNGNLATQASPAVTDRVTGAVHTAQTTTVYNPDGDVTAQTVTDLTGGDSPRAATRTYNGYDQLVSQTDPAGAKTTYTYDSFGNRASQTDPDGNLTQFTYDGDGHLLTTTLANYTGSPPGSQPAAPLPEESREYDPAGRLAVVTDARGQDTDYWYTDNGLLDGVQEFNVGGSVSYTSEANSYDGAGNLIERWTNNWVTDTTYTVDAAGRTTGQVTDPDGLDRTTTVTYTPDDQQASVTRTGPDGASQATSYTYDPAGNVLSQSVTDPGAGGPSAWYSLSQSSGTAVPDSVSGGQPATASGVTWGSGAATFSGTAGSQVATSGPVVDTTGSFTVSAWVNLAGNTSNDQTAVSQDAGTDAGFYLKYYPGSGTWDFMRPLTDTANPSNANAFSAAPAVTGTWTLLTGTYDANTGTMTLYVNGAASGTGTDSSPVAAHGPLVIGRAKWDGSAGGWFDGQVTDVQVYPRALSAGQVSALYGLGQSGADVTTNALTTKWTRDQRGLPTSMTDPDGAVTNYSYDEDGLPAVTTDPPVTAQAYGSPVVTARPVTMTGYDTFGEATETEDANGNVTTSGYDADGRPVAQTLPPYTPPGGSPITAVSTTVYDGNGLVTSETDALGNITRYGYDQLGDQVTATAPDNSVTTTAYDAKGEPLSVTGPTGAQAQATWDYVGRKLTATQLERYTGSGTAPYTTSYTYDDNAGGFLSQVASPDGVTAAYSYDEAGERTAVTDGASNTTSYAYNSLGQETKVTFPDGTATATGYDGAGNPVSVQQLNASGTVLAATSAAYDGEGDELSATDALGNPSTFTFDPTGMVTAEVQPVTSSSAVTTSFGYDLNGHRTLYTDGNGQPWQYTYNSWGLPESRVEPSTTQYSSAANSTFTTAYNADGSPVTLTEPGGVTLTSTYNNVGELTGQSGSGADAATPTRTFGYDLAGDLTSASTSNTLGSGSNATSESFTYNDRGQVKTASGSAGSTSYAYNGDGLTTSVADAAGTTGYTYDSADRLATLADPATGTTATYSYNADSLVTGISNGSGKDTQSFGYDGMRRLTSDTLKTSSGTTVASIGYGYNADGLLTSETTTGLAGPASSTYTYDEAGRLASWNNGTTTTQYAYDGNGNLTQNGSKAYTYDARDQLTSDPAGSYTYTARGTPSSESSPSGTLAVAFDAYGDQASAGTRAYAYDALGRLTGDTPAAGGSGYQFSYVGASGTIASDGTSAYVWDPAGSVLAATGAPGGGTGGALALTDIHRNQAGQFTAAGTALAGSKAYDPWGSLTATSGFMTGMLGYQSAWADPASGKNLMGARWYSPGAGDFTSADTVQVSPDPDPAAGDPFAYAADDPLTGIDPTGHCPVDLCGAGINNSTIAAGLVKSAAAAAAYNAAAAKAAAAKAAAAKAAAAKAAAAKAAAAKAAAAKAAAAKAAAAKIPTYCAGNNMAALGTCMTAVYRAAGGTVNASGTPTTSGSRYSPALANQAMAVVKKQYTAVQDAAQKRDAATAQKRAATPAAAQQAAGGGCGGLFGCALGKVTGWLGAGPSNGVKGPGGILGTLKEYEAGVTGSVVSLGDGCSVLNPDACIQHLLALPSDSQLYDSALVKIGISNSTTSYNFGYIAGTIGQFLLGTGEASAAAKGSSFADKITEELAASCKMSFTAGTRVLLAAGQAAPISSLKPGDKVLASDTRTGKDQPETVTAVEVHHDTDLYDLTVKTSHGIEVIHTTASHLFWDPYHHYGWIPAKHLKPGMHLKTPDGQPAVVVGGSAPAVHDGWMWDLTVPGNNDHDFYVAVAATAVLVHNCTEGERIANSIADHAAERAQAGDGTHYVSGVSPQDLPGYVHQVLDGEVPGVETRYLSGGRVGYWDPAKQAVIIEDGGGGTVLTPKEGHDYFEGLR